MIKALSRPSSLLSKADQPFSTALDSLWKKNTLLKIKKPASLCMHGRRKKISG